MDTPAVRRSLRDLRERLAALDADVRRGEHARTERWHRRVVGTDYALSAANLAAYLAFRRHDMRDTQDQLAALGLSSLGRLEANVRVSIASVRLALDALLGEPPDRAASKRLCGLRAPSVASSPSGRPRSSGRSRPGASRSSWSRCPVSSPWAAISCSVLVAQGMDVARITPPTMTEVTWRELARRVRDASRLANRPCRSPHRPFRTQAAHRLAAGSACPPSVAQGVTRPAAQPPRAGRLRTARQRRAGRRERDAGGGGRRRLAGEPRRGRSRGVCVDARGRERTLRVETRTGAGQVIATPSVLASRMTSRGHPRRAPRPAVLRVTATRLSFAHPRFRTPARHAIEREALTRGPPWSPDRAEPLARPTRA